MRCFQVCQVKTLEQALIDAPHDIAQVAENIARLINKF
jgi:glycerate kinase